MPWRTHPSFPEWLPHLQCHRGYWVSGLQQNSLDSIQEAEQKGYEMAEFDVRLTRDHEVILFHDEHYLGRKLLDMTFEEFKRRSQHEFPRTATFEDVCIWMQRQIWTRPGFQFKLNIEIKSKKILESVLEKKVFALIERYGLIRSVLISSFNPLTLFRMRRFNPTIYRALLLTKTDESNFLLNGMFLNVLARPDVLHLRWNDFDPRKFRKIPVPIVLWTVNRYEDIEDFSDLIHGIISDKITPEQFKSFQLKP